MSLQLGSVHESKSHGTELSTWSGSSFVGGNGV